MIEKLTAKKLREYHFDEECIKKLIEWDNYTHTYHNDLGSFFATNIENKIYSGIDALRIIYFKTDYRPSFPEKDLDLVPEYFNLTLSQYLSRQKIIAGNLFNETKGIENFISAEKQKTVELIESIKSEALYKRSKYKQEAVQKREWYLNWLNEKMNKTLVDYKLNFENHLAVKITGYGNQNLHITSQPVFYFIEDVLKENSLTPIEAIKIVEKMKGSFSPNFNNVVTPKIIEHLESLNKYYIPQVKKRTTIKVEKAIDETNYRYKAIAIAYVMQGIYINPENAKGILEKHSKYRSINTLLKNRIEKPSVLTRAGKNKTANTKHLTALLESERLLKGLKKNKEVKALSRIINSFNTNCDKDLN